MRRFAPRLGLPGPQWIQGAPTISLNITSITVTMLTGHRVKKFGSHLITYALNADPLRKRGLLSIFSVKTHLLQGTDIGYLMLLPLSA